MTEQYLPTNINAPRIVRIEESDYQITLDDSIVAASSVGSPSTLTLPDARTIPGWLVCVKAEDVAGGAITVVGLNGQLIDGAANTVLSATNDSVVLQSIGNSWAICGGGSSGGPTTDNCLTVFLVSPDPAMSNHTSIQAAYTAAVAAGAGNEQPAKILVCPGVYEENVFMNTPNIDIVAVAADRTNERSTVGGPTVLAGQLFVDINNGPGTPRCQWIGIDIRPNPETPALPLVNFGGAQAQFMNIADCEIVSDIAPFGPPLIGVSNTAESELNLLRANGYFDVLVPSAAVALSVTGDNVVVNVNESRLSALPFGDGFFGEAISAGGSSPQVNVDESFLVGRVTTADGATVEITNSTNFATRYETGASGTIRLLGSRITRILLGDYVTGSGTFEFDSIGWISSTQSDSTVSSGVSLVQRSTTPPGQQVTRIPFAVAFRITTQTNIVADTSGGAKNISLPPASSRTGPIRIKPTGTPLNPLTITPDGAETVNGSPGAFPVPAGGLTLVSEPTFGNWETFD